MNSPGQLGHYLKTLNVHLASYLAGMLVATCAFANPNNIIDLPPKPHCRVINPKNTLHKNIQNTIPYIEAGDIDTLRQVLSNGLPVNAFVKHRIPINDTTAYRVRLSLLDHAVSMGQHEIVELLLEYGAHPEGCGRELFDPINMAIANGDYNTLNTLVRAGANPNTPVGPEELRQNALHLLLSREDICQDGLPHHDMLGSMQLLLSRGADVNARNHLGETPLLQSIRYCPMNSFYPQTTLLLITHGADPYLADNKGENIFHRMHSHTNLSRNKSLWQLLVHYVHAGGDQMLRKIRELQPVDTELQAIQAELTAPRGRLGWLWASSSMGDPLFYYLPRMTGLFDRRLQIPSFMPDTDKVMAMVSCPGETSCDTPLHHSGRRHLTLTSLHWLTWLGADTNTISSRDGNTLLHFVLKNNQLNYLDELLGSGADPFIRNAEDMTSFDIAMTALPSWSRREALDKLCSSGAMPGADRKSCQNYFHHLLNECDNAMAVENITLASTSPFEENMLSSHIVSGCLANSHWHQAQKRLVLREPLDKLLDRKPELTASMSAQCHYDGCDNNVPTSGKMELFQLQSYGQVKQFMGNRKRGDANHLLTSLVYTPYPELLAYALHNGARYQPSANECPFPNDPYLCLSPDRAASKPGVNQEMAALLKLFGSYAYGMDRQSRQDQLDLSLIIAIQQQKQELVRQFLLLGANPNTFINEHQQATIARAQSTPENPAQLRFPTCGAFADALRLEMNLEVAPMSRALLLYGASVEPFKERQCTYTRPGKNAEASPLFWSKHIRDRNLAWAIKAYDPDWRLNPPKNDLEQRTLKVSRDIADLLLEETAQQGVTVPDGAISPQCACLGLSAPGIQGFTPYCQIITSKLSESTRNSICRRD